MSGDAIPHGGAEGLKGTRIRVEPAPDWLERSKVRSAPRRDAAPVTCLLSERRVHVPTKTTYSRQVNRLESPQAVQQLSRVEIPFDPAIQSVVIHSITIFRNGVLTNHARLDDIELIRREQQLEAGILNGELSALQLLKDVRTGDVLDVELSVVEEESLFGDDMSWFQAAEYAYPVGDWRFEWIDRAGHPCHFSETPPHLTYSETATEDIVVRSWTAENIPAHEVEEQLPPDVFSVAVLQVTNHGSWKGITDSLLQRWDFVPADRNALDEELASLRTAAGDDQDRLIDLAVATAREGVRYQNYSPGLLAMVPANLTTIWDRRFGDCKEKSLLLSWLLEECGFSACPALVSTTIGKALPDLLPSPALFDHVITRVEKAGKVLWIDPTDLYRGGRPSDWETLPFSHALPLRPGISELEPMPANPAGETYLKVREKVTPNSKTREVALEVTLRAGGRRADWVRSLAGSQGMPGIQKFLKSFMETTRRGVELVDDPDFEDDLLANEVRIGVRARMPEGVQQDKEHARDRVPVAPFSFVGLLAGIDRIKRRHPLGLGALDRVEHEIEVDHAAVTAADYPRQTVRNPAFQVDAGSRMEGGRPVFWFTYSSLEDRVPPAALTTYKNAVDRAFGLLDVSLNLPLSGRRRTVASKDPENRWGGGVRSPAAARAGESMEAVRILKFAGLVIVVLAFIARIAFILRD